MTTLSQLIRFHHLKPSPRCRSFLASTAGRCFALAIKLSELGHFTWKEWVAALAEELKGVTDRVEPDNGSHYYEHWLATLERLVTTKGLSDSAAL